MARSDSVTVCLHANVTAVETDSTAQKVERLRIRCLNGKKLYLSAKLFILALGAIETPRLLLLSNKVWKNGLGNDNDLVGRFFMEHPHLWSGMYIPADERMFGRSGLYALHRAKGVPIMGKLTLSEEVIRRERMLNYVVSLHPKICPLPHEAGKGSRKAGYKGNGKAFADVRRVAEGVCRKIRDRKKIKVFSLNHMSEQRPNPDSRVTLSEERDALGQRRSRLDWRMTPLDMRTIIRGQQIIDEELGRAGLGRLHIEMEDETPPPHLTGGWHHMGTTRMHTDSKKGVVDEHCRVHGVSNLFVAGPSVFPTGGYANPVLTTVALSLRLADYVKRCMG
jgi:choline dehydrogenase-like flavoprotein